MQKQEYHASKIKMAFFRCFFFCLWLLVYLGDGLKEMLIGTSIVILFGPLAIYFLVRLFRNQPSLIITDDYLYDNGSLASVGKLYWEEIEEVFIYKLANQKILGIQVSNPDQVLKRVGKVNRMMIKANKALPRPTLHKPTYLFLWKKFLRSLKRS